MFCKYLQLPRNNSKSQTSMSYKYLQIPQNTDSQIRQVLTSPSQKIQKPPNLLKMTQQNLPELLDPICPN
jgi:hypothetical protein